jgi:hypothetical protein
MPHRGVRIFHIGETPFHDVKFRNAAAQQILPSSGIAFRIMERVRQVVDFIHTSFWSSIRHKSFQSPVPPLR